MTKNVRPLDPIILCSTYQCFIRTRNFYQLRGSPVLDTLLDIGTFCRTLGHFFCRAVFGLLQAKGAGR